MGQNRRRKLGRRPPRGRARPKPAHQPKPGPKYGNAFLDALADAQRADRREMAGEVLVIVTKDGRVAMKPWRPNR